MGDGDDLQRTIAFERAQLARVSTRMVPFAWGTAYLNDGYRARWDSNLLWVERPGAQADALAAEAERVLGGAGLAHREIRIDDDAFGDAIEGDLRRSGYGADRLVVMALRRAPDHRPENDRVPAEEVELSVLRPALETVLRREPYGESEEVVRMLADFRGELARHAGARFFCARVDAEIASMCELYVDGAIAQVEDVNTLEEFRNRGLARAVVRTAVDEARRGGAELVFLHALDADWPKHLYGTLGFDPIGHVWSFVRPAAAPAKSQA
ncbi:MAG: GNAT family N-acetyltransferase [Actinomycetota bacterium]